MSEPDRGAERAVKRVLVTLDPYGQGVDALRAAAGIAADLEAELLGLLVEDIDLVRLAELPFAREIDIFTDDTEPLGGTRMKHDMQLQADRLRRMLATAAGQRRVPWQFRVTRGRVIDELMGRFQEFDLLILGQVRRPLVRRLKLAVRDRRQSRVPAPAGHRPVQPVMVLYHDSPASRRALATARRLARETQRPLMVVLPLNPAAVVRELERQVMAWLREQRQQARFAYLGDESIAAVAQLTRREHGGGLVVGRDVFALDGPGLSSLLEQLECPLVLVN
ncbi:MAG: universal stress protein [Deltaproteobacteria bacterium]|nr:universal stress protein [Candidatus Anaeroferrophillacea bacterium]